MKNWDNRVFTSNGSLVSVIIPAYNRSDLLRECLESVAKQTHPFVEVLVVDDASTELIEPIVNSIDWPKSYVAIYIRLDKNIGVGGAREAGRLRAHGNYVASLDSDDTWNPRFVEQNVIALRTNPEADLSYTDYLIISKGSDRKERRIREYRDRPIRKLLPEMFWGKNWIQTSARLWTRRAIDQIGPWLPVRRHTDVNYVLRAACFDFTVCYIPEVLAYYRESHGQEQITQGKGRKTKIEVAKSFLDAKDHLEECGKLDDSRNANLFAFLFFETAQSLLLVGEQMYAKKCLDAVAQLAPASSLVGFSSRLIKFLELLGLSPNNLGRIARRIKYSLLMNHCEYYQE